MHKWTSLLTLAITLISCLSALAAEEVLQPLDLRCEYRKNPLGIDTPKPRLRWSLEAADPATRGRRQTAYQILVSSSKQDLGNGQGDLWDSGRVESDKSIQVPYAGRPLASGMLAWWKVRVWDNGGKPSAWSAACFLVHGSAQAEDWKGKWIGLDGGEGKAEDLREAHWVWSSQGGSGSRYFRRSIEIPEDNSVSDALFYHGGFREHGALYQRATGGVREGDREPQSQWT